MLTDAKRLQQIIKNLLSNAFKFTQHGQVTLTVEPVARGLESGQREPQPGAVGAGLLGVATPASASRRTSSRSSSRRSSRPTAAPAASTAAPAWAWPSAARLSRLLGGEIRLTSTPGRGQHVHALPAAGLRRRQKPRARRPDRTASPPAAGVAGRDRAARPCDAGRDRREDADSWSTRSGDDRDDIQPGDRVLLIVENDLGFARFLLDAAREKGFKGLVTSLGRRRPGDGPRVQAGRHHARHLPARHRRLARAGAAEERRGHPAHSGLRHLHRRGARARP